MAPNILITGATGTVGKYVVERLSHMNVPIRAGIHTPGGIDTTFIKDVVETVPFAFEDSTLVSSALEGIEKVFLLTPVVPDQVAYVKEFMQLAMRHGITHIVRLSQLGAGMYPPIRFTQLHNEAEREIIHSGIPYTILRSNVFMQNFLAQYEPEAGTIYLPAGESRVSYIDARDIAEAVAEVLLSKEQYMWKTYELTGPESLSLHDITDVLSIVTGDKISYADISESAAVESLHTKGFSEWMIQGMLEWYAMQRTGLCSHVSTDFESLTASMAATFLDFARDYASEFRNIAELNR